MNFRAVGNVFICTVRFASILKVRMLSEFFTTKPVVVSDRTNSKSLTYVFTKITELNQETILSPENIVLQTCVREQYV